MKCIVVILTLFITSGIYSQSPDTLYPVKVYTQDGYKYGYINNQGNLNIKPQFAFAKDFSEGLAFVKNDSSSQWFCINTSGKVEFELTAIFVIDFSNGVAKYIDTKNERHFIDHLGKIIYDPPSEQPEYGGVVIPYSKEGKFGYVNMDTGDSLPPIYLRAGFFRQGSAPVFIKFKDSDLPDDSKCYNAFINEKGNILIKTELKYDDMGHRESGYFYSPEKWINGVCRYYSTNDPKTRVEKYIRNDGKIIW